MRLESKRMSRNLWLFVAIALALGGCTTTRKARSSAELLAAYTARVTHDAETFAKYREDLARARQRNMNLLEQSTVRLESNTTRNQERWRIAKDNARLGLFRALSAASDDFAKRWAEAQTLRERRAAELQAIRSGVNVRSKQLAATAKALGELSKKPAMKDQLTFLVGFVGEVRKTIQEAEKAGREAAAAGEASAQTKGDQAAVSK